MTDRTCLTCKSEFKYPSGLKRHLLYSIHCKKSNNEIALFFNNAKTEIKNNIINCLYCNKEFSRKDSLQRHIENSKCYNSNQEYIQTLNKIPNQIINQIIKQNTTTTPINTTPIITSPPIKTNDNQSFNYVYLIEKFDVNNKQSIFKFGKTNRESSKRLKEHGEEAKVLLILDVIDCNVIEKKILNILNNTENIKKCSFGKEYFICNDKEFLITIILKNI
jgi:hypothetical protein